MRTEVRLPQWGMGMEDGTVVEWLRTEGDRVERGDPLAEIDAAKVTETVPAPATGVLAEILVPAGETVPVGAVLALLDT